MRLPDGAAAFDVGDQERWSSFDFEEDAREIFADDSQREQLNRACEKNQAGGARPAARGSGLDLPKGSRTTTMSPRPTAQRADRIPSRVTHRSGTPLKLTKPSIASRIRPLNV